MEDLTKNQLVLLTLLVSFVTSIATGIITFSLLQEAPPFVTQTINRVVEKTIETVVSENNNGGEVREVTVVVKEEDQVIDAISKNASSVVRIHDAGGLVYGIGTVLSKEGLIIAPAREAFYDRGRYSARLSDQTEINLDYLGQNGDRSVIFFKAIMPRDVVFSGVPVSLMSGDVKLGQSVIALEGENYNTVSIGRVSSFLYSNPSDTSTQYGLETDILHRGSVVGSPLFNLSGELVAIRSNVTTPSNSPVYLTIFSLSGSITEYLAK